MSDDSNKRNETAPRVLTDSGRAWRLVAVQQSATHALGESDTLAEAMLKVLESICDSLGWYLGAFWSVDPSADTLRCQALWHDPAHPTPEFTQMTRGYRFARGIGLPGRVWVSGNAVWIEDVVEDKNFPRLATARREGLHAATAFPIHYRGEMLGVIEFFSLEPEAEDATLVRIMSAVGSQIGQFMKRTEALDSLRASEARYAAILESALDCIVSMDHQGRITDFNPAAERAFGHRRADVIGREMAEVIIPPRLREAHRRGMAHYLRTGEGPVMNRRIEVEALRSDGTEFPVELTITRVSLPGSPLFTGYLRDLTTRKQMEADRKKGENQLRQAEASQRFLVEATEILSATLDHRTILSRIAEISRRHFGGWCLVHLLEENGDIRRVAATRARPEELELVSELERRRFPVDRDAPTGPAAVIRTGQSELAPVVGDVVPGLRSYLCVPLTARGATFGALSFISADRAYDEHDLALAHELARRAALAVENARLYDGAQQAIRARDEFLSIASHELKTPITSLKLQLQMAQRALERPEGDAADTRGLVKYLDTSDRQIDRLTSLIEDLLDISRIQAGRLALTLERTRLAEVIREVAGHFAGELARAACRLELDLDESIEGQWDRSRVEQVIVNLLSNAVKYAAGSRIRIEAKGDESKAVIVVRDYGPGIPVEKQGKIFERFERATASKSISGLGLGLFIVRQIVSTHGGSIRVESEAGHGAAFVVELPRVAGA